MTQEQKWISYVNELGIKHEAEIKKYKTSMNELNIENLEWLLMVAMDRETECQSVMLDLQEYYKRSIDDLYQSPTYHERFKQLRSAEVCVAAISEQILKLKAS